MPSGDSHVSPSTASFAVTSPASGRSAKLSGMLMRSPPASPSCGAGSRARRRPSRRCRRPRSPRVGLPARITHCAPASRRAATRSAPPLGVRLVVADEADDGLPVVVGEHGVDVVVATLVDHVDAAGGEQVGGEGGARGVRRDRAHGGEEDLARRGVVAQSSRRARRRGGQAVRPRRTAPARAASRAGAGTRSARSAAACASAT